MLASIHRRLSRLSMGGAAADPIARRATPRPEAPLPPVTPQPSRLARALSNIGVAVRGALIGAGLIGVIVGAIRTPPTGSEQPSLMKDVGTAPYSDLFESTAQDRLDRALRSVVRDMDLDRDGYVDRAEWNARFGSRGPRFDDYDLGHKGKMAWSDFKKLDSGAIHALATANQSLEPATLAGRVDRALPANRFRFYWQKDRILDRVETFEDQAKAISGSIQDLRRSIGSRFLRSAPIELDGVASHFGPETLQVRVADDRGNVHAFVRDGKGAWIEREDLAKEGPGLGLFARARIDGAGSLSFTMPDLSQFWHMPRARPFAIGDSVRVLIESGLGDHQGELEPYTASTTDQLGKIIATDGRGSWEIQLAGSEKIVARSNQDLRLANNPNVFVDGWKIDDWKIDRHDESTRRMISDFYATPAVKDLIRDRPGPNSSAAERTEWEKRAITAIMTFMHDHFDYPDSMPASWKAGLESTNKEIDQLRARKTAIEDQLRKRGWTPANPNAAALKKELAEVSMTLASRLDSAANQKARLAQESDIGVFSPDPEPRNRALAGVRARITELEAKGLARTPQDETDLKALKSKVARVVYNVDLDSKDQPIGAYYENRTAQCRQQAAAMLTLMNHVGVDGRVAEGATTSTESDYAALMKKYGIEIAPEFRDDTPLKIKGVFGGYHLWLHGNLSDGSRWMVDPTWGTVEPLDQHIGAPPHQRHELEERSRRYRESLIRANVDPKDVI